MHKDMTDSTRSLLINALDSIDRKVDFSNAEIGNVRSEVGDMRQDIGKLDGRLGAVEIEVRKKNSRPPPSAGFSWRSAVKLAVGLSPLVAGLVAYILAHQ